MTSERFGEYVEEFRTFSRSHKVAFGHESDLLLLMSTVRSSERFRMELTSMVRSVLYRESEGVSPAKLERIVAVAWGGGTGDGLAPELMAEIEGFLREVVSRPASEPQEVLTTKEEEGLMGGSELTVPPVHARPNPWVNGSVLHRELMKFAEWRVRH